LTNTRLGWTAGGGLEWMVSPNWSVKAEYLYYDLGRLAFGAGGLTHFSAGPALFTDLPVASTRFDGHIVRVGLNYHFDWWNPGPAGAMALAGGAEAADSPVYLPPPPVFTWTGFYAGLNAGYTFGGSNSVDVETMSGVATSEQLAADAVAASATDVLSLRNSGFIGGGQVGYNLQFANSWVAGIEADIQGTGARSSAGTIRTVPVVGVPSSILQAQSNISVNNAVDYLGTVRGRLGLSLDSGPAGLWRRRFHLWRGSTRALTLFRPCLPAAVAFLPLSEV
jgi:opacity protein-like surface antigen